MEIFWVILGGLIFILFLVIICAFIFNSIIDDWEQNYKDHGGEIDE